MNLQQKIYAIAGLSIVVFALTPSILPADLAIVNWMNRLNLVGFTMLVIAIPVSYTHLDVYKRQASAG